MKKAIMFFLLLSFFLPQPALAYVGPGLGLSAILSLFAFVGAIFVTVFSFFWLPLKRLLKGEKNCEKEPPKNNQNTNDEDKNSD